jgi:hypothetical protein
MRNDALNTEGEVEMVNNALKTESEVGIGY